MTRVENGAILPAMDGQDCIELVAVDVERDQSRINSGGEGRSSGNIHSTKVTNIKQCFQRHKQLKTTVMVLYVGCMGRY